MEFAKYYNVTNIVKKLMNEEKISSDWEQYSNGVYVCMDTHDFWICRILEGYNDEYEQEEGSWLVERNKICKYDLISFIEENAEKKFNVKNRQDRDRIFDNIFTDKLIEWVIKYDDEQGLENWDNLQEYSLEECVNAIDGGYGIVEIA